MRTSFVSSPTSALAGRSLRDARRTSVSRHSELAVPVDQTQAMATERRPRRNLYDRLRPLRRLVRPIEAAQVRRLGKSLLSIASGRRCSFCTAQADCPASCEAQRSPSIGSTTSRWCSSAEPMARRVRRIGSRTLRANSGVAISVDRKVVNVRAQELSGAEREDMRRELRKVWRKSTPTRSAPVETSPCSARSLPEPPSTCERRATALRTALRA